MTEIIGYVWLAGLTGIVIGWIVYQILDDRKNRRAEYWLRRNRQ